VVTFAELERDANRLAHLLSGHGVGPGDHVGLYARNSIEAVQTMIATYKLRAVPINVNYRYVEAELRYLFDNADLVALVHDREFTDRVAAVRPDMPGLHTALVTEELATATADRSAERDFGPRAPTTATSSTPAGRPGSPKGVMWRHEDVWRVLGGGIDFVTGNPLPDEWAQSRPEPTAEA
jgi:acyl-CoA synthetase (AMP-forming)/AMP-acid ligase II